MKNVFGKLLHGLKDPRWAMNRICEKYYEKYIVSAANTFYGYGGISNRNVGKRKRDYKISNEWDSYSEKILSELKASPMGFLRQPMTSTCLHPNMPEAAGKFFNDLVEDDFCRSQILPRLYDLPIGNPHFSPCFHLASPLTIQHAHHYMLMKKYLDIFIPENKITNVVEFGGGYGNFSRLAFSWGYTGNWDIIDIPEMHNLQEYYLSYAINEPLRSHIKYQIVRDESFWNTIKQNSETLFIATFSLSETPSEVRNYMEEKLKGFKYIFFAYNGIFGETDCLKYFDELRKKLDDIFTISNFCNLGQYYMTCTKKDNQY
ncbi:hypothetical protein FACS1894110_03200 [Spirochaetia bacterium]|nr:hypothetical protein FACS1894110_03200 [Spirochaetia bacterium]